MKGTKLSQQIRQKMSNAKKGKKLSKENRDKRSESQGRAKVQRSDGVVYFSRAEAARDLRVDIAAVIVSIKKGYKCKGYTFTFFEEKNQV